MTKNRLLYGNGTIGSLVMDNLKGIKCDITYETII
jgi:hypothetical protein